MICYLFQLLDGATLSSAKREIHRIGLKDIYIIEDDATGEILLGGSSKKPIDPSSLKTCLLLEKKSAIDWTEQWARFAEDFREGKAHIDLSRFGAPKTLQLLPGPGFGDLSHPTTFLMLELMSGCMQDQTILDIGCGSGILALSSLLMGATQAYGIDIDEEALSHARENASLNQLSNAHFSRTLPQIPGIVLLNMIFPEQQAVLQEIPQLPRLAKLWISSGILESEREKALAFSKNLGLELIEEKSRGEWRGFKFRKKHL